jgi:hypothetical protein
MVSREAEKVQADWLPTSLEAKQLVEEKRLFDLSERLMTLNLSGAAALTLLGLVTTYAGLFLWYQRVQVYQDKILKRDAETSPETVA